MTATEERVRQLLHTVDQQPVQRRDLLALARARRRRQRLLLAACGLVLVLLAGLLTGWAWLRPGEGRRAVIAATPSPETSARRTAVPVSPSPSPSGEGGFGSAGLHGAVQGIARLGWGFCRIASGAVAPYGARPCWEDVDRDVVRPRGRARVCAR